MWLFKICVHQTNNVTYSINGFVGALAKKSNGIYKPPTNYNKSQLFILDDDDTSQCHTKKHEVGGKIFPTILLFQPKHIQFTKRKQLW